MTTFVLNSEVKLLVAPHSGLLESLTDLWLLAAAYGLALIGLWEMSGKSGQVSFATSQRWSVTGIGSAKSAVRSERSSKLEAPPNLQEAVTFGKSPGVDREG
jgi:hypothetical protein